MMLFKAHKLEDLSAFNWFIGEQAHLKVIDDFYTQRAASVQHPAHLLAGAVYLFLQRLSFSPTRGHLMKAGPLSAVRRVGLGTHARLH